jgi:uncharacterized protein (TIGR04255 family)
MTEPLHYPTAPITEAIIDLRVKPADAVERALLKQVGEAEKSAYPHHEEIFEAVGQMAVGLRAGSASVQHTPIGWRFSSADHKRIVQSRLGGFTFSKLAPYDSWGPFRNEARHLWQLYRETLQPDSVVRVAVRYINRIDIPGNSVDLKDYFRTSPEIAPDLPQKLEGYFMQLRLPYPEVSGHCLINQTIVPPVREDVVSVVLDIDLFRTLDLPQDEEAIWGFFEKLHDAKNFIFESCITDSARRLFSLCQS